MNGLSSGASITVVVLFAVATIPVRLAAQDQAKPKHHHYKLIEIDTFGGPNSYFSSISQTLNKHGAATGFADTPTALNHPFCLIDCFATHAFEWKDGGIADLGALGGIDASFPNDINSMGIVAGLSLNGGFDPALDLPYFDGVVFKDEQITDLGTFGGPLSYAAAINDHDEVVGFALNSTPDSFDLGDSCQTYPMPSQMRAFIWKDGAKQDLGTLGGTDSCALFVNNRGQATGVSFTNSIVNPTTGLPTIHPFLWNGETMMDLGSLGGTLAFANGINDRGQVAGASSLAGDQTLDAFIWENGKLTDLGNLGGSFIEVIGFNEAGDLVGKALLPDDVTFHAFLANKRKIVDLGSQEGNPCSYAVQVNLKVQVVGYSDDCSGNNSRALLWENNQIVDLNAFVPSSSGLTLTAGTYINDRGEITAQGVLPNGDQRAVLLIPCGADDEGCADGTASATTVLQSSRPLTPPSSTETPANPTFSGRGVLDRLRARRFPWRRSLGAGTGPSN